MSQEFRDLLLRAAESAPPVRVDEGLWRRARRARRRRLILAPVVAAAVMVGVLGIAWQGSSLLAGADRFGPAAGRAEPAVPSRVYPVPDHLDGVSGDEWTYPREDTLEVGRAAVALTTQAGAPVVVSALDGSYHLLDLPGLQRGASFRFEDGVVALSPDGRRLAYTWNEAPFAGDDRVYAPSGVRIADLTTGEVESHQVRAGFGVFAHGFSWSSDGRYLAYNMQIASRSQSGTGGTGNVFVERLDTTTGERLEATGVPMTDHPPAVTDAGTVVAGSGTTIWTWRPDQGTTEADLLESGQWRGSLMSIGTLPGSERILVSAGLEYSRLFSGTPDDPESFERISAGAPRLTPAGPVGRDRQAVLEQTDAGTTLWTIRATGPLLNDRSADLVQVEQSPGAHYSFATRLLRRPTRDFPAPDWPLSTEHKLLRGVAMAVAAGLLGALGWRFRRRRRSL